MGGTNSSQICPEKNKLTSDLKSDKITTQAYGCKFAVGFYEGSVSSSNVTSKRTNISSTSNRRWSILDKLKSWTWQNGNTAIVKLMLPVYYTSSRAISKEVEIARLSWKSIVDDSSPVYTNLLSTNPSFAMQYTTSIDWFMDVFYERLFDVHPLCKPMFRSAISKGSFIHGLLSFLFTILEDKSAFRGKLLHIAGTHCKKGVKAAEYGIIGEVMFWSLEHCLGKDIYNRVCHGSWVKIFSSMLEVIVPVVVAYELAASKEIKSNNRVLDQETAYCSVQQNDVPTTSIDTNVLQKECVSLKPELTD